MELKVKKDKGGKKRKLADSREAHASSTITTPLSAKMLQSTTGVGESENSADAARENLLPEEPLEESPSKKRKTSVAEIEVDISKPEPPSKKSLRRLKKGKLLPPPEFTVDSSLEPEEEKPQILEAEKRSEHGIWIGNLPWSVTKAGLKEFLTSNLDITDDDITRVHMPRPSDGKPANKSEVLKSRKKQHNKGFAYVDFSAPEAVRQAIELSEHLLSGRRVLIKDKKSFAGRPPKAQEESWNEGKSPSRRIFLGNLRFDTTEDNLKEHFEKCGPIESVMVATFEDSGKCKGYAWITFEELEAAKNAIRGFVLVQREDGNAEPDLEKTHEVRPGSAEEEQEDGIEEAATKKLKNLALKKWRVDKIHKRPVRREFAEDPQVRYKKRYGKDGTKGKVALREAADLSEMEPEIQRKGEELLPVRKAQYRTPYRRN